MSAACCCCCACGACGQRPFALSTTPHCRAAELASASIDPGLTVAFRGTAPGKVRPRPGPRPVAIRQNAIEAAPPSEIPPRSSYPMNGQSSTVLIELLKSKSEWWAPFLTTGSKSVPPSAGLGGGGHALSAAVEEDGHGIRNYFRDLTSKRHWNGMVLFCKQPHLLPVPSTDL
jgi:hypothetical protein